ncbi:sensor histidine kinase [Actinomadura macrotermitis]|uniref:sensor histidine kinase n=1 Tax=Actinomadura macrotermitis TaxID=2585200 RepID=UPI002E261AD5
MDLRRTARDLGVLAAAVVIGLFMLQGALEEYPGKSSAEAWRDVAVGAAAMLVLVLFRRRWPVRVCLLLTVAWLFSAVAMGAMAMASFTVAVHRPWRATAAVAALNTGLIALTFALVPLGGARERVQAIVVVTLGYAVLIAAGLLVRSRRQLISSLRERARQAEEGQRLRVEEARLLERERIAREMHDVLAHRISLLAVHAGALEFPPGAPAAQRDAAGVIRRTAYEAMEDLRQVIGVLRDDTRGADPDRPQPTLPEVPALVEQARAAGAHVTLEDGLPDAPEVPDRIGRHAYRIVQEGLTNARKHAPGAPVRVALGFPGRAGLTVEIVNPPPPGPAADALPGAGAGLLGLRERVALVGGTLEHGRTGDGGFRLYAWLPVPADEGPGPGRDL